ncbi:TRAP transporter small permease subunit [Aliamphritea ceti]|uniref:TRAP transporter small permease subunit n=1 Tax=Aliamphritea ceti TaxID=1524258 RepID=UPI0021C42601|nr:TRAP transporter small permease subunit [Aliamphritea ceti]
MISKYLEFQDGLSDLVGRGIRWLTLLMLGVLLFEIGSRYLLGAPTEWAHESSTMLYGSFCILAGAYTLKEQAHVRSDVLYSHLGTKTKGLLDTFGLLLTILCMLVFFKLSLDFAIASWEIREFSSKSTWQPPVYPFKATVPVAVGLLILQLFAELIRSITKMLGIEIDDPRSRLAASDS